MRWNRRRSKKGYSDPTTRILNLCPQGLAQGARDGTHRQMRAVWSIRMRHVI